MADESSFSTNNESPVSAESGPPTGARAALTASPHEQAFYGATEPPVFPETYDELAEIVLQAQDEGRTLVPSGTGSHAYIGLPPASEPLIVSLRKLDQIVRYEPDDFTIGAQAGTPVNKLREALAENRQEIPVDVSTRSASTLGGWLAVNPSSARQTRYGLLRNYLIGLHGLRGGRPPQKFKSGSMVVKNVAGYEAGKFLLGSLGTAGFIVEANFKLRPLPAHRSLSVTQFSTRRAAWTFVRAFHDLRLEPAILQVLAGEAASSLHQKVKLLNPQAHAVIWQFEGNESLVTWQNNEIEKLLCEHESVAAEAVPAEAIPDVTDFTCEFSEPPAIPPSDLVILRLGDLPKRLREFETALFGLLEAETTRFSALSDALSGLLTLRLHGSNSGSLLAQIRELVQSRRATGTLLYLSPTERSACPYYHFVPNAAFGPIDSIRHVFDPEAIFIADRVFGREKS